MRKLILSLIAVSLAGFCFAPIELGQKPSNGYKPPAATEQDLQRQQQNQKTMGQVGSVPEHDGGTAEVGPATSDGTGSTVLGQAQKNQSASTSEDPQAKQVLAAANDELARKQSGVAPTLFVGGIFLCLGFAVVFGIRQWATKNMPDVPTAKQVNW